MPNNDVVIHLSAKDDASGKIDKAGGNVKKFGKAAGLAFGAAGLAGAGFALAAVRMATSFETSMSEVKTLLPDMNDGTFKDLADDLRDLSKEMGLATSDSVPALYSAISAGVPPDNVISFMELAAKAAVGGMTSLETAVNGITTVVNSYGAEVISAKAASDIMFSAVKDGKTNFDQLSTSLATVLPIAASLDVSFEEVAASVAKMTSMGMKTTTATSGLRGMFVEATKSGTELDKAIRSVAGASMAELIASGETAAGVLDTVRGSMPDQEFRDLFGSVEASGAALMLTGDNFDSFSTMLEHAEASAGALDTAFDTVSETTEFKLNQAISTMKDMMLEVGERILPYVVLALEMLMAALELVGPAFDAVAGAFKKFADSDALAVFTRFGKDVSSAFQEDLGPAFENIVAIVEDLVLPMFSKLTGYLLDLIELEYSHLEGQLDLVVKVLSLLGKGLETVTAFFLEHAEVLGAAFAAAATYKGVMLAYLGYTKAHAVALKAQVFWTTRQTVAQWAANSAMLANPAFAVALALAALVAVGILVWKNWDTIAEKAKELWAQIKNIFGGMVDWVTDKFGGMIDWVTNAFGGIASAVGGAISPIIDAFSGIADAVTGALRPVTGAFGAVTDAVTDTVGVWVDVLGGIVDAITGAFRPIIDFVKQYWPEIASLILLPFFPLVALATDAFGIRSAFIAGLREIQESVTDALMPTVDAVVDAFRMLVDTTTELWDTISGAVSSAIESAVGWLVYLYDNYQRVRDIVHLTIETFYDLKDGMVAVWKGIVKLWGSAPSIFGKILDAMVWVVKMAWNAIHYVTTTAWDVISSTIYFAVGAVYLSLKVTFKAVIWLVTNAWDAVASITTTAWELISEIIYKAWEVISDSLTWAFENIQSIAEWAWERYAASAKAAWELISGTIKTVWEFISLFIVGYLTNIAANLKYWWGVVAAAVKAAWELVSGMIKAAWELISGIIVKRLENIASNLTYWWGLISTATKAAWELIYGVIKKPVDLIVSYLERAWDILRSVAAAAWDAVAEVLGPILDGIYADVKEFVTNVIEYFGGMKDDLLAKMSWAKTVLFDTGRDMMQGLLDGLSSLKDTIMKNVNAFKDKVLGVLSAIPGFLLGGVVTLVLGGKDVDDTRESSDFSLGDFENIPGGAKGGIVKATQGGIIMRLAEAGQDEAIIPLGAGGIGGLGSTTNNITINLSGVITDPVATGQAVADALNRASITTGPLVLSGAVQ